MSIRTPVERVPLKPLGVCTIKRVLNDIPFPSRFEGCALKSVMELTNLLTRLPDEIEVAHWARRSQRRLRLELPPWFTSRPAPFRTALDAVVGPFNWRVTHQRTLWLGPKSKESCVKSRSKDPSRVWISKSDGADCDFEPFKGELVALLKSRSSVGHWALFIQA